MQLLVKRIWKTEHSIIGELSIDGGTCECFTLERPEVAIPAGNYAVSFYDSPKNKRKVPLILVPGRKFIEIHIGNFPKETEGCLLVGSARSGDAVGHSKDAFEALMKKLEATSEKIFIEVRE